MTLCGQIITVAMCVLGTMLTRFMPFVLFSPSRPTPKCILYLGRALPGAVFGMLVVYCLKNISFFEGTRGIPEFAGIAVTVLMHLWRRNMTLSMAVGTAFYMVLVQVRF